MRPITTSLHIQAEEVTPEQRREAYLEALRRRARRERGNYERRVEAGLEQPESEEDRYADYCDRTERAE